MFLNAFNTNCNSEKKRLRALDLDEFQNAKKRIFDGLGSLSLHDEKTSHIDRNQSTASSSSNKNNERYLITDKSNTQSTFSLSPRSQSLSQTYNNTHETTTVMSIDSDINELCEDFPTLSTKKPIRKVDFLIDDLIRKSRRKYEPTLQSTEIDYDSNIPSSVGPKPTTDHILSSRYWPIIAPTPDTLFPKAHPSKGSSSLGVSRSDSIKKLSPLMLNLNNLSLKNTSSLPPSSDSTDTTTTNIAHDNNKTHTEWIIEEIDCNSSQYLGDTSSNSTSAEDVHTLGVDRSSRSRGGGGGVGVAHHRQCLPDPCMMAVEPDEEEGEEGEEGDTSSGESDDLGLIIP